MIDYNEEKINADQALRELQKDEYANWSHEAATALLEYLEELEESSGASVRFDPVDLRCAFSEYTEDELEEAYGMPLKEIEENTIVLEVFKGSLVRNFIIQEF